MTLEHVLGKIINPLTVSKKSSRKQYLLASVLHYFAELYFVSFKSRRMNFSYNNRPNTVVTKITRQNHSQSTYIALIYDHTTCSLGISD